MSAEKLENFVLNQIRNLINNPKAKQRLIFDTNIQLDNDIQEDSKRAIRILEEIPKKLQRQQEAYEAGLISMEVYGTAVKRLKADEEKYRTVAGDYKIQLQELTERKQELENFTKSLKDFDTLWDNSELQEKKHFLKNIIKEIRAGNGKIEIDFRF